MGPEKNWVLNKIQARDLLLYSFVIHQRVGIWRCPLVLPAEAGARFVDQTATERRVCPTVKIWFMVR